MHLSRQAIRRRGLAAVPVDVAAAGVIATTIIGGGGPAASAASSASSGKLPVKQIETIEQAQGDYSSGVLSIDIDRDYRLPTGPGGVKFKPGFEIVHELYFQMLSSSTAMFNGDVAVKAAGRTA